jgi:hypothetical protein
MVVMLLFVYKSRVTWLELKDFVGIVQAKKHKKITLSFDRQGRGLTSMANFPPSTRAAFHNPERISL